MNVFTIWRRPSSPTVASRSSPSPPVSPSSQVHCFAKLFSSHFTSVRAEAARSILCLIKLKSTKRQCHDMVLKQNRANHPRRRETCVRNFKRRTSTATATPSRNWKTGNNSYQDSWVNWNGRSFGRPVWSWFRGYKNSSEKTKNRETENPGDKCTYFILWHAKIPIMDYRFALTWWFCGVSAVTRRTLR